MTIWDSTHAELADALRRAGRIPLDTAHVLTLAVEAIDDLEAALEDAGNAADHAEEVAEFEGQVSDLERDIKEAEEDKAAAEARVKALEADLAAEQEHHRAAQANLAILCAALAGDDDARAQTVARLVSDLDAERKARADERAKASAMLCEWARRLFHFADDVERPRSRKSSTARGLRLNAADMERFAGKPDAP